MESCEEKEEKRHEKIFENRDPIEVKIHETYYFPCGFSSGVIGSFKRKSKGREYVSPRILLNRYFRKYVGKGCLILEGKGSIEKWSPYQNCDVLLCLIPKQVGAKESAAPEPATRAIVEVETA